MELEFEQKWGIKYPYYSTVFFDGFKVIYTTISLRI